MACLTMGVGVYLSIFLRTMIESVEYKTIMDVGYETAGLTCASYISIDVS
jgi:hypothetical protein